MKYRKILLFFVILALIAPLFGQNEDQNQKIEMFDGISTGDLKVDSYIVQASQENDVDPLLIFAQVNQESTFRAKAVSRKGAKGLMQLMPGTAKRFGVKNAFDQKQNIYAGVKYMRWLLDQFDNDIELALAGYNAGEGAVMKYGKKVPPYRETKKYVQKITAHYQVLQSKQLASL